MSTADRSYDRRANRWPTLLAPVIATIGAIALIAITLRSYNFSTDAYHWAARYTARFSFAIFLIAYAVSSWHRLWPGRLSSTILRNRRSVGLSFAGAHTVHLGALSAFARVSGHTPGLGNLIPGGLGYALMLAMTATSNDWSVRALGPWWQRLHRTGIHYLWFIFAFTFFSHARSNDPVWGPIFVAVALAALGLRATASRSRATAGDPVGVAVGQ